MTNGPKLVSKRARKPSGAVSVSCDGSASLLVCADKPSVAARTSTSAPARRKPVSPKPGEAGFLRTAGKLTRFGVNTDTFPFLDEQRHADFEPGVGPRHLGDRPARGVAARSRLGFLDRHLDERWKLQADRVAVELVDLDDQIVDEQIAIVADHVRTQRQRLEALLIHE